MLINGCTPSDEPKLARDILRYLLRNPEAADTIEGLAHWRLMEQEIYRTTELTRSALEWLVARGFVMEVSLPDARKLFQLNKACSDQAQRFLKEVSGGTVKNADDLR
jgi:hypothetical protein